MVQKGFKPKRGNLFKRHLLTQPFYIWDTKEPFPKRKSAIWQLLGHHLLGATSKRSQGGQQQRFSLIQISEVFPFKGPLFPRENWVYTL